ncbi:MAG: 6-phosphogluconolactonase [Crocinitomicaceae bacterium]|nr:6-phosphogluconolactonase [Crocinitomicaceae bacterium]
MKQISKEILKDLEEAVSANGVATILLSGGGTPGPIYRQLDKDCSFLSSIHIGLVDERFVPPSDEHSNERLIRSCFRRQERGKYQISGMVIDSEDSLNNLEQLKSRYQPFIENTDVVILGMGKDGHIASIFPKDVTSELIRKEKSEGVFTTLAPLHPKKRITCGLGTLLKAKNIYLVIYGKEKREVLLNDEKNLPIHDVLRERTDIKVIYAEND